MSESKTTIKEPLASIGDRIMAYLIDFLIIQIYLCIGGFIMLIVFLIMLGVNRNNPVPDESYIIMVTIISVISGLVGLIFNIYYLIFWPARHEGQSIGKKFMKIRIMIVENLETGKIRKMESGDVGTILMRLIFSIVDALFFYLLGIYIMNNDPNNQRFADQQAKTVVIKES